MAERYEPGVQRIFYRAANFETGLTVTVYFIDPDLNRGDVIPLSEVDAEYFPGLYCFKYTFHEGNYVAYFWEEETQRRFSQAYSIRWIGGISIDHSTDKTVIERKGDPTNPIERGSNPNEPIERGH